MVKKYDRICDLRGKGMTNSPLEEAKAYTKRTCLKCLKQFPSLGKYNRICGDCNDANLSVGKRVEKGGCRSTSNTRGRSDDVN